MEHSGSQIAPYLRDQMNEVVDLLNQTLWGNSEQGISYFHWKYHENPYSKEPFGVTASHNGRIVGFRGYFATEWCRGRKDTRMTILLPGDTVVHPDYRRRGLSVAMGNLAMAKFVGRCSAFLNMSAGKNSVPGYLRMGFAPLQDKVFYTNKSFIGDVRYIYRYALKRIIAHDRLPLNQSKVSFGEFGKVLVSKSPKPEAMSRLASYGMEVPVKITLFQDQRFFRWRFENPLSRYAFYFCKRAKEISGYVVMKISDDNTEGSVVDYGLDDEESFEIILDHIADMADFETVTILNVNLSERSRELLRSRQFRSWGLVQFLKKQIDGQWPILVRPVKQELEEEDWILGGLDIRKTENWRLKGICSDAA